MLNLLSHIVGIFVGIFMGIFVGISNRGASFTSKANLWVFLCIICKANSRIDDGRGSGIVVSVAVAPEGIGEGKVVVVGGAMVMAFSVG